LITGISLLLSGCNGTSVDYACFCEFVYANQTDYTVRLKIKGPANQEVFLVIHPQSVVDAPQQIPDSGKTPDSFIDGQNGLNMLLDMTDNLRKSTICIDHATCVDCEKSGVVEISNYQCEMLGERHFKYTYTFTDADFADAKPCTTAIE
jgi:hypothetical protein